MNYSKEMFVTIVGGLQLHEKKFTEKIDKFVTKLLDYSGDLPPLIFFIISFKYSSIIYDRL